MPVGDGRKQACRELCLMSGATCAWASTMRLLQDPCLGRCALGGFRPGRSGVATGESKRMRPESNTLRAGAGK